MLVVFHILIWKWILMFLFWHYVFRARKKMWCRFFKTSCHTIYSGNPVSLIEALCVERTWILCSCLSCKWARAVKWESKLPLNVSEVRASVSLKQFQEFALMPKSWLWALSVSRTLVIFWERGCLLSLQTFALEILVYTHVGYMSAFTLNSIKNFTGLLFLNLAWGGKLKDKGSKAKFGPTETFAYMVTC